MAEMGQENAWNMKFFSDVERDKNSNTLWVERWRPKDLDTYVADESLKQTFLQYIADNDIPHLLFHGRAGVGKTTLAKILANSIECDYLYINASDENSVETIRSKVKTFASSVGFRALKIVILDEADFISPQAQAALRNLMETFSQHTRFILTCNYHEKIIDPVVSSCQVFELAPLSRKEVALHLSHILTNEGVTFDPKDIGLIVNQNYPDIRKCINNAQRNTRNKVLKIDERTAIAADYKLKILDLLKKRGKDTFNEIRQIVADNKVRDFSDLYKLIYDSVEEITSGDKIVAVVLAVADSQYRDSFVVDKEITFMSCIGQILNAL